MRVLMVWDGNYPWDVRVEKILTTLNAWGYETHLVCRNSNAKAFEENLNGTLVHRLFAFRSGLLKKLNGLINFPAFFSPVWLYKIFQTVRRVRPDIIIIRDLPVAPAVIPFAKWRKIPVVLDMAECYPELIRCVWKFDQFNPINILVRNPYFADCVERHVIKNVDLIWVMIEESASRLRDKGVLERKLVKVSNTPMALPDVRSSEVVQVSKRLEILYLGLVNPSRGVSTVVLAAALLKKKGLKFHIKIVGSGKAQRQIANLVNEHKLEDEVELTGWIDRSNVQAIIDHSDIGLVPHFDCSHWNSTIPNKLFDYMQVKIPVIVSSVKPAARIVESTGCGLVFRSGDAQDLAEKIFQLRDAAIRREMGEAGGRAIATEFNWQIDSQRMQASMLELLASRKYKAARH